MQKHRITSQMPRKKTATEEGEDGFAQRLRSMRKERNLSQTELGQIVDLHYTHIGRYERGSSRPAADALNRLAQALGVSSDYLLGGASDSAAVARFEDRELMQQFQEIEKLDTEDKHVVKIFLDAFLTKRKIARLVAS